MCCVILCITVLLPHYAAPGDYNSVMTTLTFDENTERNCVDFTGFEDDVVDPNENFTVVLTGGDDVILMPDTAVVTIVDQIRKGLFVANNLNTMYTISTFFSSLTIMIK